MITNSSPLFAIILPKIFLTFTIISFISLLILTFIRQKKILELTENLKNLKNEKENFENYFLQKQILKNITKISSKTWLSFKPINISEEEKRLNDNKIEFSEYQKIILIDDDLGSINTRKNSKKHTEDTPIFM